MPKLCAPLTDTAIRNAKPREKTYTLGDGEGMYLEVMPNGTRFWRMAYRQPNGKKNRLTFGKYPEVPLAEARDKRLAARKLMAQGIDPDIARREEKHAKEKSIVPRISDGKENTTRAALDIDAKHDAIRFSWLDDGPETQRILPIEHGRFVLELRPRHPAGD